MVVGFVAVIQFPSALHCMLKKAHTKVLSSPLDVGKRNSSRLMFLLHDLPRIRSSL